MNNKRRKTIARERIEADTLPTSNVSDATLKDGLIINLALNYAFRKLVDNDMFNERSFISKLNSKNGIKNIEDADLAAAADNKKFVCTPTNINGDVLIILKVPIALQNTISVPLSASVSALADFGQHVATTELGLMCAPDWSGMTEWSKLTLSSMPTGTDVRSFCVSEDALLMAASDGIYALSGSRELSVAPNWKIGGFTSGCTTLNISGSTLLVGSQDGLDECILNDTMHTISHTRECKDLRDKYVTSIATDSTRESNDDVVVGTDSGLYSSYYLTTLTDVKTLSSVACRCALQYNDMKYFGSDDKGAFYIDNNDNIHSIDTLSAFTVNRIVSFNDKVWFCTSNGLYCLNGSVCEAVLRGYVVNDVLVTGDFILVATGGEVIWRKGSGNWNILSQFGDAKRLLLSSSKIYCLAIDGLHEIDIDVIETSHETSVLSAVALDGVICAINTNNGILYGTSHGIYDSNLNLLSYQESSISAYVRALAKLQYNGITLYAACANDGAYIIRCVDNGSFEVEHILDEIQVNAATADDSRIVLAAQSGLYSYDALDLISQYGLTALQSTDYVKTSFNNSITSFANTNNSLYCLNSLTVRQLSNEIDFRLVGEYVYSDKPIVSRAVLPFGIGFGYDYEVQDDSNIFILSSGRFALSSLTEDQLFGTTLQNVSEFVIANAKSMTNCKVRLFLHLSVSYNTDKEEKQVPSKTYAVAIGKNGKLSSFIGNLASGRATIKVNEPKIGNKCIGLAVVGKTATYVLKIEDDLSEMKYDTNALIVAAHSGISCLSDEFNGIDDPTKYVKLNVPESTVISCIASMSLIQFNLKVNDSLLVNVFNNMTFIGSETGLLVYRGILELQNVKIDTEPSIGKVKCLAVNGNRVYLVHEPSESSSNILARFDVEAIRANIDDDKLTTDIWNLRCYNYKELYDLGTTVPSCIRAIATVDSSDALSAFSTNAAVVSCYANEGRYVDVRKSELTALSGITSIRTVDNCILMATLTSLSSYDGNKVYSLAEDGSDPLLYLNLKNITQLTNRNYAYVTHSYDAEDPLHCETGLLRFDLSTNSNGVVVSATGWVDVDTDDADVVGYLSIVDALMTDGSTNCILSSGEAGTVLTSSYIEQDITNSHKNIVKLDNTIGLHSIDRSTVLVTGRDKMILYSTVANKATAYTTNIDSQVNGKISNTWFGNDADVILTLSGSNIAMYIRNAGETLFKKFSDVDIKSISDISYKLIVSKDGAFLFSRAEIQRMFKLVLPDVKVYTVAARGKDVLVGTSAGMYHLENGILYKSNFFKTGNVTAIAKGTNDMSVMDDSDPSRWLVACDAKVYMSVTGDDELNHFNLVIDLAALGATVVTSIKMLSEKVIAAATDVGIFTTDDMWTLLSTFALQSTDKIDDVMDTAYDAVILLHINLRHGSESPVTYANEQVLGVGMKELDMMKSYADRTVFTDDYVKDVELDSDIPYISAQYSNYCNAYDSLTSSYGWTSISGVTYIIKNWKSCCRDMYIYLPTTGTLYTSHMAGMQDCSHSEHDMLRSKTAKDTPSDFMSTKTDIKLTLDNKHFDLCELFSVQIVGNSLPLNIYQDSEHQDIGSSNLGFHSYMLPSVTRSVPVTSTIIGTTSVLGDKIELEFSCFGTDAQAIHIVGTANAYYTVHFEAGDSDRGNMDDIRARVNDTIELPTCKFIRDGYVLKGWSRTHDGAIAYSNRQKLSGIDFANDEVITLFPIWQLYVFDSATDTVLKLSNGTEEFAIASGDLAEKSANVVIDYDYVGDTTLTVVPNGKPFMIHAGDLADDASHVIIDCED